MPMSTARIQSNIAIVVYLPFGTMLPTAVPVNLPPTRDFRRPSARGQHGGEPVQVVAGLQGGAGGHPVGHHDEHHRPAGHRRGAGQRAHAGEGAGLGADHAGRARQAVDEPVARVPLKPATGSPVTSGRSSGCSGAAASARTAARVPAGTASPRASPLPSQQAHALGRYAERGNARDRRGRPAVEGRRRPERTATSRASASAMSLSLVVSMRSTISATVGESTAASRRARRGRRPRDPRARTSTPSAASRVANWRPAASAGSACAPGGLGRPGRLGPRLVHHQRRDRGEHPGGDVRASPSAARSRARRTASRRPRTRTRR